jgi:hypothetical protein
MEQPSEAESPVSPVDPQLVRPFRCHTINSKHFYEKVEAWLLIAAGISHFKHQASGLELFKSY